MPKYKIYTFSGSLIALFLIFGLVTVMTYPRYQKTTEQQPELIDYTNANEALLQIKAILDEVQSEAGYNEETKMITAVWTGSVCASKYRTLSGSERIYYACPYIIAETSEVDPETPAVWSMSLHFAVSALKDDVLMDVKDNISVDQIEFAFRVKDDLMIAKAGYGDGSMMDIRELSVNYQFRDRTGVNSDTSALARLEIVSDLPDGQDKEANSPKDDQNNKSLEDDHLLLEEGSENEELSGNGPAHGTPDEEKEDTYERVAVLNWSFVIHENNHIIGNFDDVQMEFFF